MGHSFHQPIKPTPTNRGNMRTISVAAVSLALGRANAQIRTLDNHLMEKYFFGYGCWCHFDENHDNLPGTGRGKPMDEWDAACKRLQEGYECAVMDFDDCEPWNAEYDAPGAGFQGDITRYCDAFTDDDCARAACIVESTFVNWVGEATIRNEKAGKTDLSSLNDEWYHSNDFDVATCETRKGPREDKACCGADSPNRFPYKADHRVCC